MLKTIPYVLAATMLLAACGEESPVDYPVSAQEAKTKLMAARFPKGILPGYSSHWAIAHPVQGTQDIEWIITYENDLAHASGELCDIKVEPSGADGKRTRVYSVCKSMFAKKDSYNLDQLIKEVLTGQKAVMQE